MHHLKGKKVRFVYWDNKDGFICFCFDDYDDCVSVFSTSNTKYLIEIPIDIEPESLEFYDVMSIVTEDENHIQKRFAMSVIESDLYCYQSIMWKIDKDN